MFFILTKYICVLLSFSSFYEAQKCPEKKVNGINYKGKGDCYEYPVTDVCIGGCGKLIFVVICLIVLHFFNRIWAKPFLVNFLRN